MLGWLQWRGWQPWALRLVCGAWSCVGRVGLLSVTDEKGWSETCKSNSSDVQRAPSVVASSFVIRAVGKGENQSDSTGVRMKIRAPRFVAWFVELFLMLEMSKIDGSNSTGGQMKAPRFVAWSSRI